jgi:hypothetical protein
LGVDLLTAGFVFLLARKVFAGHLKKWGPVLATALYLLSYNTIWCNVVARPDTFLAFFSILGLYLYYRSHFGDSVHTFWLSGMALGMAAGMKLHGAFCVIFIVFDLFRIHGFRAAVSRCWPFVLISVISFAVAAGTPLFDPLLYAKLRVLNAMDDASPWIQWGEQFLVILRGTGWLIVPLVLASAVLTWRSAKGSRDEPIRSIIFLSLCWLVLFSLIRPLRAYWMLPALPLFYIAAVHALSSIPKARFAGALAGLVLGLMLWQSADQAIRLRSTPFNQLRSWIESNVSPKSPFFIFGYEAINLPRNTQCIGHLRQGLNRKIASTIEEGKPFTQRHIVNWEERSALELLGMLDFTYPEGYSYYSYYATPLDEYQGIIQFKNMDVVLIQEHFPASLIDPWKDRLENNFTLAAQAIGSGGGGRGLRYRIYERKE